MLSHVSWVSAAADCNILPLNAVKAIFSRIYCPIYTVSKDEI
jgi:hypothetical protein